MSRLTDDWLSRLLDVAEQHPERTSEDLGASFDLNACDIEATRVHLGSPFPDTADHEIRTRTLWIAALHRGLNADIERQAPLGTTHADLLVGRPGRGWEIVVEVKSRTTQRHAATQVLEYKRLFDADLAVVTAHPIDDRFADDARARGVAVLTGQQTLDLIDALADGRSTVNLVASAA